MIRDDVKRLKRFTIAAQEQQILKIVAKHQKDLLYYEKGRMFLGLDSAGKKIRPPYRSTSYKTLKLQLNPLGVVDLFFTGKFYDSFFVKVDKFPVKFGATDEKTKKLTAKYGAKIFGETEKDMAEINAKVLLKDVRAYYRTILELS